VKKQIKAYREELKPQEGNKEGAQPRLMELEREFEKFILLLGGYA
jgi:hypothetical protein